jgi:hypothetical protein
VTRYELGGHTHYKLDYHFVWRTKFNRPVLGPVLTLFWSRQSSRSLVPSKSSDWVWRSRQTTFISVLAFDPVNLRRR